MENLYSFINIRDKLKSLSQVSGCSGTIFFATNQIYVFPDELESKLSEFIESKSDFNIHDFLEPKQHVKTITMPSGELIFIDPSESVAESTLRVLGDQLEEETQLMIVFDHIFQASLTISSNLNLNKLLHKVMSLTEDLLKNEVSAVILKHPVSGELRWEVSRGDQSDFFEGKQTLPLGKGIAGNVALTGEVIVLNDVHSDARWDATFDKLTGFKTRSLMCVPITFHGNILGVIEIINKKEGEFTSRDLRILEILAAQTGAAIENARIHGQLEEAYEELKLLDKAKERVINHLSHELKTPLATISGVLKRISMLSGETQDKDMERALARGQRNVNRLFDLHYKIDDILNQKVVEEKDRIFSIIESAADLVEEFKEEGHQDHKELLERISQRIESLFKSEEVCMEQIRLNEFLDKICTQALTLMVGRDLAIDRHFDKDITLTMDKGILSKCFLGLLKNAIENTPDEGRIEVTVALKNNEIHIEVQDYGVGITKENQKLIFGGFFHTQDTDLYSSRIPYAFNAGGTGSDLLRIKSFSERFGFSVHFKSTRCGFIPTDNHRCVGKISGCEFIKDRSECLSSGGSLFSLIFPCEKF